MSYEGEWMNDLMYDCNITIVFLPEKEIYTDVKIKSWDNLSSIFVQRTTLSQTVSQTWTESPISQHSMCNGYYREKPDLSKDTAWFLMSQHSPHLNTVS